MADDTAHPPDRARSAAERLAEDVERFVRDPSDGFGELALRVFTLQYQQVEPFRRLCDARGATPATLATGGRFDWRRVPAVPTTAFRGLALHVAEPREVFRSSGTTGGPASRSVHHHPFPDLYRAVIDVSFAPACLPPPMGRRPILSLVPSRRQAPDSSLGFLCDHVLRRHGSAGSRTAFGDGGVETPAALAFLRAFRGRPVTILATAFALAQLLDALGEADALALAAGSTVMETGGFKGRRRQLTRAELLARIEALLGVPADHVVREYGMTELTGHVYSGVLSGGDPDVFLVPPWMRVRLLDPETLAEVPAGTPGLVAAFDLANVGSAVHVVSQDLGVADGAGFRLLGRAVGSEPRGCSLAVEELGG